MQLGSWGFDKFLLDDRLPHAPETKGCLEMLPATVFWLLDCPYYIGIVCFRIVAGGQFRIIFNNRDA